MEEHIKQIEAVIEANLKIAERTPWLDSCLGLLRGAVDRAKSHIEEIAKVAAEKVAAAEKAAKAVKGE